MGAAFWFVLAGWAALFVTGAGLSPIEPDLGVAATTWVPALIALVVLVAGGLRLIQVVSAATAITYAALAFLLGGPWLRLHGLLALVAGFWSLAMASESGPRTAAATSDIAEH